MTHSIEVVDSHTAGEPTRVVIRGGPDLGRGSIQQRLDRFRESFDQFRSAIVGEPRGSDVLVGALLCEPADGSCNAGVVFFNNVGYLGMCGHGMIGVIATLKHLGRIEGGQCKIETPVGVVSASLGDGGSVSIDNVPSYRQAKDVAVDVDGVGQVVGDVAWGGNWFYLVHQPPQEISLAQVERLQYSALAIRRVINDSGFPEVDHVELFGSPQDSESNSRNFVLCPGLEYDRSPCGTGTSAKLACLATDGKLLPGETWIQEGILGTHFVGRYRWQDEDEKAIVPTITGSAHITAESELLLSEDDPFCWGVRVADGRQTK